MATRTGSGKINQVVCGRKSFYLHIAVATAFIENPHKDLRVVFLDGDTGNCRADNLRWSSVWARETARKSLKDDGSPMALGILEYMDGNKRGIDGLLIAESDRLTKTIKKLHARYNPKVFVDCDEVYGKTLELAMGAIRRGLLRDVTGVTKWFKTIAENVMINMMKENKTVSANIIHGENDELDLTDKTMYFSPWEMTEQEAAVNYKMAGY